MKTHHRILLVVIAAIMMVFVAFHLRIASKLTYLKPNESKEIKYIPFAKLKYNVENSAYLFYILGAQGNQINAQAAIESLVKIAGWDGKIYIITDRDEWCVVTDDIIRDSGMRPENLIVVKIDQSFGGLTLDFSRSDFGMSLNRYRSWGMKTSIFDYIEDKSVEIVAVVDGDILFGIEGCAKDFVTVGPPWTEAQIRMANYGRNSETGELMGIHSATIVLHRYYSAHLLTLWRQELNKELNYGDMDGDNDCYMKLYRDFEARIAAHKNSSKLTTFQTREILLNSTNTRVQLSNANPFEPAQIFPPGSKDAFEHFYNPSMETGSAHIPCMTHISKKRCDRYGRGTVQDFVNRFRLVTYKGKYPYCLQSYLQPLLYGGFPINYIPFCPKLEFLSVI